MSKRDYFLQKGLQMKRLDEQITASSSTLKGGSASREVTTYRELCPPGTPDSHIQEMIGQCKGDAQRMENVISELWEDYRGHGQDDAWATVSKKTTKKKHDTSFQRSYSSQKTQQQQDNQVDATNNSDAPRHRSSERPSLGGRGSTRGRGTTSSRGGRGGRGGRGRGGAIVAAANTSPQSRDKDVDSPEMDDNCTDGTSSSNETSVQQSSKSHKDSKRERGVKTGAKATTAPPVAQAPPVVYPVLTGAWTKKLNVNGATATTNAVGDPPAATPAPTHASTTTSKVAEKTTEPGTETDESAVTDTSEVVDLASPKKKTRQDRSSKKTLTSSTSEAGGENTDVVEPTNTVEAGPKDSSPQASPKKAVDEKAATDVETTTENPNSNIGAGWGALDVSASTMDKWPSSTSTDATEPKKTSTTTHAWARNSPVLSPPASKENAPSPKSPDARQTAEPESPKGTGVSKSSESASTSPRPYLKMGKWDSAATPNLSLQFGSFSLSGIDTLEPTSPRGWASTTTTTSSSSNSSGKTIIKSSTTQTGWGTTNATLKKTLSPDRSVQSRMQDVTAMKAASSVPPGLSVDSGRVTPTTGQSPQYAPSAPSPASLPKPDEVKRGTPTRTQTLPFQAPGGSATQTKKTNIGYGTGLYQSSYGQYSMDLARAAVTSTPGQLSAGSGTPKGAVARNAATQIASQSPTTRGQQSVMQTQQMPLQQGPTQQQQQQIQQQSELKQMQQQQAQQQQQPQQNPSQQQTTAQLHQQAQAGMQQGYHYAPPPPPGMALPYNPYNYAGYYQGYGYYQNPQFAQYSPRTQYPPRGSMPYGVEGPVPGFSNPPNMPYQDQHMMAQQHEYAAAVPQGFGEINAAYMQQAPMQQGGHHVHQNGPQGHGKGRSTSAAGGVGAQQAHGQHGISGIQGYQNVGRDHASPPVPNASAAMTGSYGQHYGWAGNYGAQPVGGWSHMMPQGYQQSPSQQQQQVQQQQQQQQQPNAHQQSYHQYGNGGGQVGSTSNDVNQSRWSSS